MAVDVPMTIEDLLERRPELRFRRHIAAMELFRLLGREHGQCTWCGVAVPRGRRSWCGDRCVTEYKLRMVSQFQADAVRRRDNDTCQICSRHIPSAIEAFWAEWKPIRQELRRDNVFGRDVEARMKEVLRRHGFAPGNFSEVDHIVPVSEGGGCCTIDNLRLLCGGCHAQETKRLHSRLAARRKESIDG